MVGEWVENFIIKTDTGDGEIEGSGEFVHHRVLCVCVYEGGSGE